MSEVWRQIELGNYSVSSFGNVRNDKTSRILSKCANSRKYYLVHLFDRGHSTSERVHRLVAMAFIPNPNNHPIVDHIDGVLSNNNISNLRWVSCSQNQMNTITPSNNKSGVKGVYWDTQNQMWRARITFNGVRREVGYFKTIEEANVARSAAAEEYHGAFQRIPILV